MRVIAGEFRSRVLKSVPGIETRPTPDRLREALFNVLQTLIANTVFVDAYAGTGSVGIEALSRGAARSIFIEQSRMAVQVIRDNLQTLQIGSRAEVLQGRVLQYLPHRPADIVFLDPPYEQEHQYDEALSIAPAPLVIAQHSSRFELEAFYGPMKRTRILRQGDNTLSFYELQHSA